MKTRNGDRHITIVSMPRPPHKSPSNAFGDRRNALAITLEKHHSTILNYVNPRATIGLIKKIFKEP
ncbi:hypothetical protein [[Limnothrix rosea] IAM M-220]|uniref:hypothetical protein n=1 Tax=[Limnothrix rosea] IAM M-220 TaxID=454133 RepID=UPI00111559B4|nr:hypothetical protein [[Limnothrix rosea] IAM M-220]